MAGSIKKSSVHIPSLVYAKHIDQKYNVDWNLLKEEWVTTDASLSDLAKKYQVPIWLIKSKYIKHAWKAAKDDYNILLEKCHNEVILARARYTAEKIDELDNQVMHISEELIDILERNICRFKEVEQSFDVIDDDDNDDENNKKYDQLALLKSFNVFIEQMTKSLKEAHYSLRLSGNRATAVEQTFLENNIQISSEEEDRIRSEIEIIKDRKVFSEFISQEESSDSLDCDKSSQDTQK